MQTSLYQWLEDVLRRVRNGHSKEYRFNSLLHRVPFVDFHDERKLSIPDDEDRRGKAKGSSGDDTLLRRACSVSWHR